MNERNFFFQGLKLFLIRLLFSVVTSLLSVQEVSGSILNSAMDIFLVENYSSVFTNWALVLFVLCPCSVLCCLRRRLCTGLPTAQRSTSNCIRFPIFDPQYHPYPLTTPCKRNRRKWKCFFWERDYYSFVLSFWKHHDLGWDSITFTYVCEQWS